MTKLGVIVVLLGFLHNVSTFCPLHLENKMDVVINKLGKYFSRMMIGLNSF